MTKLALLNTTITTTDGLFEVTTLSLEEAKNLFHSYAAGSGVDSAIGHDSTAQLFSTLVEGDVVAHRQMFEQQPGQEALVLKLKGRAPEGVILTLEQIEEIGYEFKLMTRLR
jgi:hypothetical protein